MGSGAWWVLRPSHVVVLSLHVGLRAGGVGSWAVVVVLGLVGVVVLVFVVVVVLLVLGVVVMVVGVLVGSVLRVCRQDPFGAPKA